MPRAATNLGCGSLPAQHHIYVKRHKILSAKHCLSVFNRQFLNSKAAVANFLTAKVLVISLLTIMASNKFPTSMYWVLTRCQFLKYICLVLYTNFMSSIGSMHGLNLMQYYVHAPKKKGGEEKPIRLLNNENDFRE